MYPCYLAQARWLRPSWPVLARHVGVVGFNGGGDCRADRTEAMARALARDCDELGDDGARVKARRERLALDKSRLASEAGVSRLTLAANENGQGFRHSSLAKIE